MNIEYCLLIIFVSVLAALAARFSIDLVISKAAKWGALDLPNERKIHKKPIPRLGGMAIIPGVWLGCSLALVCAFRPEFGGFLYEKEIFVRSVIGLLLGCFGMFCLGFVDDVKQLSVGKKLAVQVLVALIAFCFLPIPSSINGLEVPTWIACSLMLGWLIIVPNSVNLLDGVDGLTASLFSLFLLCLSLLAFMEGSFLWLIVLVPSFASTLSFLRFNWNPARIFLGDSGSLTLGFMVAYFSLAFAIRDRSMVSQEWNFALTAALSSIWLMDTLYAILRRYARRAPSFAILLRRSKLTYLLLHSKALRNVVRPDRMHLHHRLISLGFGARQVVLVLASFWISFILLLSPFLMNENSLQVQTAGSFPYHRLYEVLGVIGLGLLAANIYVLVRRIKKRLLKLHDEWAQEESPAPKKPKERLAA